MAHPRLVLVDAQAETFVFRRHGFLGHGGFYLHDASQGKKEGGWIYLPLSTWQARQAGNFKAIRTSKHEVSHDMGWDHPRPEDGGWAVFRHALTVGFGFLAAGPWRWFNRGPVDVDLREEDLVEIWNTHPALVHRVQFPVEDPNKWRWKKT
jgi:hypothetical protein